MLRLEGVTAAYGPIVALRDVSLEVEAGSVVTILGANGAGKTSTLRVISGLLRPQAGVVEFEGVAIDRLSPDKIVRLGIVQVPEGRQLFSQLTVRENLELGAYLRRDRAGIRRDLERVFNYFPILAQRQRQAAGSLSGGEQQMLAIGRALMARPRLLLLDEPSLGLAPLVTREIFSIIRAINQQEGITVLLVEQNARLALDIARKGYVLETGRVVLSDLAENLRRNEEVRRSYLGY
ncbi:MAG: ABC transporter ATP-binding protein [Dehalococcoidia bacterium]|jgi:branched-chain amino acid transport system ATP-binding protein|nr:ABC transporter ATP-binding protein [Dehalococcoidia bacterium]MDW8008025.1 ABC transporter ATP-binding protein [Chloroflexota bacterium]